MLRIYIAGPYRAATPSEVDRNIITARDVQAELLRMGHAPFCPHSMTARFERDYPDLPDEAYLETDLVWVEVSDAMLMLPGWEQSSGSRAEEEFALDTGLPVYYSLQEVPKP
jgi:hypothetical protein